MSVLFVYRVTKWLEEEPERRKRLQEEKKKRLQQRRAQPKHYFDDQAYMKQLRANEEEMDDALKQGCVYVCVCVRVRVRVCASLIPRLFLRAWVRG